MVMDIRYDAVVDSPIQPLGLVITDGRLVRLDFLDPGTPAAGDGGRVAARLADYFAGDIDALDEIPVGEVGGSPFQRRVWAALRTIPPGQTISYAELATAVGQPGAVRAVGNANGRNPVPLVVPCHRVVRTGGALGGYGGGVARKQWLLDHERNRAAQAAARVVAD